MKIWDVSGYSVVGFSSRTGKATIKNGYELREVSCSDIPE